MVVAYIIAGYLCLCVALGYWTTVNLSFAHEMEEDGDELTETPTGRVILMFWMTGNYIVQPWLIPGIALIEWRAHQRKLAAIAAGQEVKDELEK